MFQINWKIKALILKILFILKAEKILFFIQKKITKRANINIDNIDPNWEYHLKYLKSFQSNKILEFGAGKSLEQNIFLNYQLDEKFSQTVIDVSNMIDINLFNEANNQIAKVLKTKKKPSVKSINEIKKIYKIEYIAPCTIEEIKKLDFRFDACISTTTLEHLPIEKLKIYLETLKKVLKRDVIISSLIDYSDHYCHTDKNIGALNFLKFSEKEWKKYNTPYLFQNRLRHQDYRKLFEDMDYEIIEEKQGSIGIPPENISNKFDIQNKETYILWAHFVLKVK